MAVTRKGSTLTMTADADAATGIFFVSGATFQGTGLTPGERLLVTDTAGNIVADYLTEAAIDNADLWNGRRYLHANGLLVETAPSGTWVLTIFLE